MKKIAVLILTSIFVLAVSVSLAEKQGKPLSEFLKEQKKEIEKTHKENQAQMAQAKASADKEKVLFLEDVDATLEANSRCYQEEEELDIRVCMLNAHKKLAEKGNFIAQDMLAKNYLEFHENIPMALKWYKKALENARTPSLFKDRLLKDIVTLEGTLTNEKHEATELTKKEIRSLEKEKENALKQKRKAELLEDQESFAIYKEMQEFLDVVTKCYDKKDDHEVYICTLEKIKQLAEKNNFVAQHQLGNIYENSYENKEMALQWYQRGLENKKAPESYYKQLKQDLERVQK